MVMMNDEVKTEKSWEKEKRNKNESHINKKSKKILQLR